MENADRLIEKMKALNVKPKPKWHFTTLTAFYWLLFIVSVILGAFAFSVVLFSIQQIDFDLMAHMSHSRLEFIMGLAPFFWLVSLLVFLAVAMVGIKNSKKGYKFSYSKIVAFSAAFSILLGTLFFLAGGAQWLENAFATNVGVYESVQAKKTKLWMMPEQGYLAGTITEVEESSIQLSDFNDKEWTIDISLANIPGVVVLEEGEKIKITGQMISPNNFKAQEIRPWGGMGQPLRRGKGSGKP